MDDDATQLCDTCKDVFTKGIFTVPKAMQTSRRILGDPWPRLGGADARIYFVAHKSSYHEMKASACSCICCAWLLKRGLPESIRRPETLGQGPNVLGFWLLREDFGISNCVVDYRPRGFRPHTREDVPLLSLDRAIYGTFEIVAAHDSPAASDVCRRPTARDGDLSYVKRWLNDCVHNHPNHNRITRRCASLPPVINTGDSDPFLPTRVLDLRRLDEFNELRLIESSGMRGQYAALTWCWGPNPENVFKTTRETLPQRQTSISKAQLNLLFQDIVHICQGLHISFLWIDALCIVQDDTEDWRREADRMSDVYSNAFLTVSATSADSPDTRLFKRRHNTKQQPLAIPYHRGGHVYLQPHRFVWGSEVDEGAVSQRGWCLQERFLSRRILHIAKGWYEWECVSTTQHETRNTTFAYDNYEPLIRPHGFEIEPNALLNDSPSVTRYPYNIWYRVLEAYTARQMTHEKDRLPGIMGLADQFAQLNDLERDKDLFCGLWKSDLIPGLMWGHAPVDTAFTYRPSSEPTASWSWLSTAGPKEWLVEYDPETIAIKQVSQGAREASTFTITLQGFLIALKSHFRFDLKSEGALENEEDYEVCFEEDWDEEEEQLEDPFNFIYVNLDFLHVAEEHKDASGGYKGGAFVLVFTTPIPPTPDRTGRKGWGMILTKTGCPDHYGRIGYADIACRDRKYPGNSCEEFWKEQELSTVFLD